jgi:RNA polymerase sigma factor (sigma-70 family)
MDDAALARRIQGGDASAWADVYDRYADRLHDYCASILHDRHEAEDALHDAFVTASQRIGQLRDPDRLRPWLYAICRTTSLGRARRRSRVVPTEDAGDMTAAPVSPDPVEAGELQQLVWDAAEGLTPQDKAVLHLHLRHGFVGQELADALEVSAHHANVRLSRVRDLVERSLTVLLVGRLGRRDCPELDALLAGWDGRLDPRLRKRVARHIDGCEMCEERRRTVVSPLGLLAAAPLVPAPPELRDRVLTSVRTPADGGGGARRGGRDGGRRRRWPVAGAAVAAVVVLAVVLALRPEGTDPAEVATTGPTSTTHAPTSTTTTTTTTVVPSTTTTAAAAPPVAPARLVVRTGTQDLGLSLTRTTVAFANEGDEPLLWTAGVELPGATAQPGAGTLAPGTTTQVVVTVDRGALPEGSFGGTLVLTGRQGDGGGPAGSARVGISGRVRRSPVIGASAADRDVIGTLGPDFCRRTEVQAAVTDESPLTVVLRWTGGGASGTSSAPMARDGGGWVATLGPPLADVDITWWIEATDALGASTRGPDHLLDVQLVC